MADATGGRPTSLAVVGLACRFPDADDAPELLDAVLTGRRAFRRIPPIRLDLAEYYQPDPATSDATYSTRAALIEGWRFDCASFGIGQAAYGDADPALWLALETTARALAAAGLAGGTGLNRDRTGVIIGNTLGGDTSRANALRVRWPYVRRVLADALTPEVPARQAGAVLRRAERRYLAPFPPIGPDTLAGSSPHAIASAICGYFGFRGGSQAVDSALSSSLQAVAWACTALASGELDAAVAGGVDISLDPLELIGLAKAGQLATGDVRIYDEQPTGYLPAEGCGVVVLMRTADARAAGLPVYAEIVGWGTSATGTAEEERHASSALLAMQRAYEKAALEPSDIHLLEGNGTATADADDIELAALGVLRKGALEPAVLGAVKANIGHAKAAAGAAGLIKAVLCLSNGVLPPATGVRHPHPMISEGDAQLKLPQQAQDWPDGVRLAGVTALSAGGTNVHLVLRSEPAARSVLDRLPRLRGMPVRSLDDSDPVVPRLMADLGEPVPFLLHAPDRFALAAVLTRLADTARWLSDAELQDLACTLAREPGPQGPCRIGLIAAGQEQLAAAAADAVIMLGELTEGLLSVRPAFYAADNADGRIGLLLSGGDAVPASSGPSTAGPSGTGRHRESDPLTATVSQCLDALRWLESLDAQATVAVGHGTGMLAGLAWAGVLGQREVIEIARLRAQFLRRSPRNDREQPAGIADATGEPAASRLADTTGEPAASRLADTTGERAASRLADTAVLRAAIRQKYRFGPPRRRLISTLTGAEVSSVDDAIGLICSGFTGADQLAEAVRAGAIGATVLVETGPGDVLTAASAGLTPVPAVSLGTGLADPARRAQAAAAMFAAGAIGQPQPLFAGWPSRPIDIWRERVFITSPCELRPAIAPPPAARRVPEQAADSAPVLAVGAEPTSSADPAGQPRGAGTAPKATAPAPAEPAAQGQPLRADEAVARAPMTLVSRGSRPAADDTRGVAPWARCFAEELRPADPARAEDGIAWRLHVSGGRTRQAAIARVFAGDPAALRTLAVVADPADDGSRAVAALAARDALETGHLVVLTTSPGFTGFFAVLHAEHPDLGVTVLRIPDSDDGFELARPFASAEPGQFRELVLLPDGTAHEPVMAEQALTGRGSFPLGPEDVVLVSRGARGAGLALAQVLACCGTGVAVIGRPSDGDDSELVAGLEQLRSAGARVGYEVIDLASPASLAAAVERIEARLGPVTAIGHAAGPGDPVSLLELSDIEVTDQVAAEVATLERLVASVRAARLRLIITFGSVAGRYGLVGGSVLALGSGALAGRAAQLAAGLRGCRSLHVEMPGWSTGGLGDGPALADRLAAAGMAPVDVGTASRLLLKIMTTPGLPARVAVHGRVGGARQHAAPARAELEAAGLQDGGRFVADVRLYYPGIELICAPRLSLDSDPYLADYCADELPVLPPALALEALAQAASVLAGRPVRSAAQVRLESPVVVPQGGHADLRVCALREGNTVTAVLRCADSSFAVDHARAEFSCADADAEMPAAALAAASATLNQLPAGPVGLVDGAELYGPIAFQSGRFRRVALLPEVTQAHARALARGADELPWFGPDAGSGILLGSPGLNDACLQVVQACVPHRRLRPAGCSSVTFSGRAAEGAVEIRAVAAGGAENAAVERPAGPIPAQAPAPSLETGQGGAVSAGGRPRQESRPRPESAMTAEELADQLGADSRPLSKKARRALRRQPGGQPAGDAVGMREPTPTEPAATASAASPAIPASRAASDIPGIPASPAKAATPAAAHSRPPLAHQRWDIEAVDSGGHLLVAWRNLEVHDGGPLPRNAAWPPALLSVYLEGSAVSLGLDRALKVVVSCGQPTGPRPQFLSTAVPRQAAGGAGDPAAGHPESTTGANGERPGAPHGATAAGTGALDGFALAVTASVPVACGWTAVDVAYRPGKPTTAMAAAYARIREQLAEPPAVLAARLRAIAACLAASGQSGGRAVSCDSVTGDGWALLTAGAARIACAVVDISGVPSPVAVAILTGQLSAGDMAQAADSAEAVAAPVP